MEAELPKLVAMIQTTWPEIRVGLYKRPDATFQFIEEGLQAEESGKEFWSSYHESGLYADLAAAKADMLAYYVDQVEDEFTVDPDSVTILEAPDFIGPFHPVLRPYYPD